MSTFPKVDTVQSILKKVKYRGDNLTDKQIASLIKLKFKDELLFSLKESTRFGIIKTSETFRPAKKRFFLETTRDIRTVKVDSYIQCKRCKEYQVDTTTKQVRSSDEGETTFNRCRNCGYKWTD